MRTNSHGCQITLTWPPSAVNPPSRLATVMMIPKRMLKRTAPTKGRDSFRQRCLHEADIESLRQPRTSLAVDFHIWLRPVHFPPKESLLDGIDNRKLSDDHQ